MKERGQEKDAAWAWGLHSVEAAIENCPELILEFIVEKRGEKEDPGTRKLLEKAAELDLRPTFKNLPRLLDDKRTQGVAVRLRYFPTVMWKTYLEELNAQVDKEASQWVVLDEVQDPRNFGAIIRSAAAFGVKGIFVASKNQAPITGVVAQTSAGTVFRIPIVVCNNLRHPLEFFHQARIPVCALDMGGQSIDSFLTLKKPQHIVWVLGSEGEGLSPKLAELCSDTLGIPMSNGVESLNVSAAGTVIFYIASKYLENCL